MTEDNIDLYEWLESETEAQNDKYETEDEDDI